jgi:large subunit ribosomal protein L4
LDPAAFETPSTKQAAKLLAEWGASGPVLVVLSGAEERAALSFRNVDRVSVLPADGVGVADVVAAAQLLVSEKALEELTVRVTGQAPATSGEAHDAGSEASRR